MASDSNKKFVRNRKHHEKSKRTTDFLLLRLPKGGKEHIDQIAHHFGVARPALFDAYLLPFLGVIAEHQAELSRLARDSGCSMPTLLSRLIARASEGEPLAEPIDVPTDVVSDFEALFGGSIDEVHTNEGGA